MVGNTKYEILLQIRNNSHSVISCKCVKHGIRKFRKGFCKWELCYLVLKESLKQIDKKCAVSRFILNLRLIGFRSFIQFLLKTMTCIVSTKYFCSQSIHQTLEMFVQFTCIQTIEEIISRIFIFHKQFDIFVNLLNYDHQKLFLYLSQN